MTILFVAALGIGTTACASEQASLLPTASTPPAAATAVPAPPADHNTVTTLVAPASTVAAFAGADNAACVADQQAVQLAVESYLTLNGGTEAVEADVVAAGLLREQSPLHDIAAGALVIPAPGSPCLQ